MTEPTVTFDGDYSEPGSEPVPWAEVDRILPEAQLFWISTVRTAGRPHVTPMPAVWADRTLHFCAGDQEQKTANLSANPQVALTTGTPRLHRGVDVVVEGEAVRITDHDRLVELAALWKQRLDWDYTVGADSYDDGAGHVGLVFGVRPTKILSFGKSPHTQARYTL